MLTDKGTKQTKQKANTTVMSVYDDLDMDYTVRVVNEKSSQLQSSSCTPVPPPRKRIRLNNS